MNGNQRSAGWMLVLGTLCLLGSPAHPAETEIEVYEKRRTEFTTEKGAVKGYEVRARAVLAFPMENVLDATHDHRHLAEMDRDIEREDLVRAQCTQELCRINTHIVVGTFFLVGEVTYELDTEVEHQEDGTIVIEWRKSAGTRFIKYLNGRLRLGSSENDSETTIDYHMQIAAPRLSPDKLADKARAYLERLDTILRQRHEGEESLWLLMQEED